MVGEESGGLSLVSRTKARSQKPSKGVYTLFLLDEKALKVLNKEMT